MIGEIAIGLSVLALACAWHGIVTLPRQRREVSRLLLVNGSLTAREMVRRSTARGLVFKLLHRGTINVPIGMLLDEQVIAYGVDRGPGDQWERYYFIRGKGQ